MGAMHIDQIATNESTAERWERETWTFEVKC